jgi:CrcB protein
VQFVLVALGGLVGVLVRYGLTVASASIWVVCAINVAGCFALGVLTTAGGGLPADVRAGVGTGLLGGLTTFSTFGVQAVGEADAGRLAAASAYVVISVAGGVVAAAAGWALGRALTG